MKLLTLIVPLALAWAAARAAPLPATTAVQTRPEAGAPSLGYLKAGAEPVTAGEAPEGWLAVSLPGPFSAYVRMADFTKQLDVVPGSAIYLSPAVNGPVLTRAVKGDKITITGLRGKWTQISLDRPVTGYIHPGPLPASAPALADALAPGPITDLPPASPAPAAPSTAAGHPAAPENSASASAIRMVEGRFAAAHKLFGRRPYQWELTDSTGARLAYLDVSKLLLTEQMDKYIDHQVAVSGAVTPVPHSKDVVVAVESLQLK